MIAHEGIFYAHDGQLVGSLFYKKHLQHDGNITMDDVYECARIMRPRSMARKFAGTVKEILGTCVSVGCTVDGEDPKDLQAAIDEGELVCPDE